MTETNLTGAALEVAQKRETQGLNHTLGVLLRCAGSVVS